MANNSNFKHHMKISFMLTFILMVWLSHTKSLPFDTFARFDNCIYGYDYEKPRNCTHGSYTPNNNREDCPREFCYLGLREYCDLTLPETRCARGLTCMCGKCMNCKDGECNMELCQPKDNLLKRAYEKNWLRLYNRGGNIPENGYYY